MEKLAYKILEILNNPITSNDEKTAKIKELCEDAIFKANRDKHHTPTEKKRLKAIEKFMDEVEYKREIFQYIMVTKDHATYTNGHMMAIIPRKFIANIQDKYILPHTLLNAFPDCTAVIPKLTSKTETCTIKYADLLTFRKLAKLAQKGLRCSEREQKMIYQIPFTDSIYRAYNAQYLIHCCEVAGTDKITLTVPAGKNHLYVPATITTENDCKFIICGCKGGKTGETAE